MRKKMNTKYYLAASVLTFAVLLKFGAPLFPLFAGICLVGLWTVKRHSRT